MFKCYIAEKENWRSVFISIDQLRFLNKFYRSDLTATILQFTPHIIESIQNLRSSIRKNSLMLVKEIFEQTSLDSPLPSEFYQAVLGEVVAKSGSDLKFIATESIGALRALASHLDEPQIPFLLSFGLLSKNKNASQHSGDSLKAFLKNLAKKDLGHKLLTPEQSKVFLGHLARGFQGKIASVKKNCRSFFMFLKKHWTKLGCSEVPNLETALQTFLDEKQQKAVLFEINKKSGAKARANKRGGFRKFLAQ